MHTHACMQIASLKRLVLLDLAESKGFTGIGFESFEDSKMKVLNLSSTDLCGDGFRALAAAFHATLEVLGIRHCYNMREDGEIEVDAELLHLKALPHLQVVRPSGRGFNNRFAFRALESSPGGFTRKRPAWMRGSGGRSITIAPSSYPPRTVNYGDYEGAEGLRFQWPKV